MKQTFIQFAAGRGPEECNEACYRVSKMFIEELTEKHNIYVKLINFERGDKFGYKSIIISVTDNIDFMKKEWEGTIKYISTKNSIRPNHKRKNWFVRCSFIEYDDSTMSLDKKDVKIDRMRASGPGGQHVNKTESCVRLTHIPSGISVTCDAERSQTQNIELGMKLLAAKISQYNSKEEEAKKREIWLKQIQLERGNEVKTIKGEL